MAKDCVHCGAGFEPTFARAMYCGKRCKLAAWRAANPDRMALLRKREQPKLPTLCAYIAKACGQCGQAWGARRQWTVCPGCSEKNVRAAADEARLAVAFAQHKSIGKVVRCAECAASFCPLYGASHTKLCLPCADERARLAKRAQEDRRKARIRGASGGQVVSRVKVFGRDGWQCRLCAVATPRALMGTMAPDAPELDHIVPVSRGGEHSYANTQCLCRSCNGLKGARTMDEMAARQGVTA